MKKLIGVILLAVPLSVSAGEWITMSWFPEDGAERYLLKAFDEDGQVAGAWIPQENCDDVCYREVFINRNYPKDVQWHVRTDFYDDTRSKWSPWNYIEFGSNEGIPTTLPVAFELWDTLYNGGFKCKGPNANLDYRYEVLVSGDWVFGGYGQMTFCESGPISVPREPTRWRIELDITEGNIWESEWVLLK